MARLAHEIWYEHYVPIVGRPQVDYMVAKFQSIPAITEQIAAGCEYFLGEIPDDGAIAYGAIRQDVQSLFLSKLYVLKSVRRAGVARALLHWLEGTARARGAASIWLTVNKQNPAIDAYLRLGFAITGPIVADIGDGFVMDDYRMEKAVAARP